MSDIQPGDVVVCVKCLGAKNGGCGARAGHGEIRKGGIYRAENVIEWLGKIGVVIAGHHADHPTRAYLAEAFRKIRPATDEFTLRVRKCRPIPVRDDA